MGDYEYGRENGLWGEDGIPYDLDNNDRVEFKQNNLVRKFDKSDFPGMRESGSVENNADYTIAEYEDRGLRLKNVAESIKEHVPDHFVLYDKKGGLYSNNSTALRVIEGIYGSPVEIDGDLLTIYDGLFNKNDGDVIEKQIISNSVQYWHMQLHPDSQNWGKEKELLETFSLIGLGKTKSENAYNDFEKMNINDVVLIKNGSRPIALVRVVGKVENIDENKDASKYFDWFKYRRKVIVLDYANDSMESFPQPRGTLSIAKNKNTSTYQYIDKWFKSINTTALSGSRVAIPRQININRANPAFGVEAISKILSSIIVNIPEKSGMMVGIFGKWGRGKTYLVNKIWENISNDENLNYKRVNFSAWKYQDTKESWAYLYETFMQQYLSDRTEETWISKIRIKKIKRDSKLRKIKFIFKKFYHWGLNKIEKTWVENKKLWKLNLEKHKWFPLISFGIFFIVAVYWNIFGGGFDFIKFMLSTFGVIFSIKLFLFYLKQKTTAIGLFNKYFSKKSYVDYLGLQAEVENELENLVKTWIPKTNGNEKIILFVDDIDRCNIEQIISIVDGLRVILDNPEIHNRLIIITAIDEKILHQALIHKYNTIKNGDTIKNMYQEYLEKVFIIGIKLNQLDKSEIEEFLLKIIPEIETENKTIDNIVLHEANVVDESENYDFIDEKVYEKRNNIENPGNILKEDLELTAEEKSYLVKSIRELDNATPRKIRIFYYKYLILKQLFHNRLEEKNLIHKLDTHCDERVIMDMLIHISNHKLLSDFVHENKDIDIIETLKYTSNMVSAL